MNARSVNAAAGVVQAAWAQGRRTAAGIALALDSAQMLMSPETAAELERLRARVAELEYVAPSPSCVRCYGADAERFVAQGGAMAPCPVCGPSELEQMRAEVAELREERHSTNESVSEAAEALRVQRDRIAELEATNEALRSRLAELEGQRAALAERLRAGQTWRQGRLVSEDYVSQPELREIFGIPLAAPLDGITRLIAPLQALREEPADWRRLGLEDPHDSPLRRTDRVPHDLPPLDGRS